MPEAYSKPCQISNTRHVENPGIEQFFQRYLGTFSNIQPCPGILRDTEALLLFIEPYSDIQRTLCNPSIYSHAIFRNLAYLKREVSPKACWTCKMIRHIQSPSIVRTVYLSIFNDI